MSSVSVSRYVTQAHSSRRIDWIIPPIAFRTNYGDLLKNFTASGKLPVFRTESEDRMVKSALNFAAGFFGIPYEGQYNQEITIESPGFNNTFAP